MSLKFRPIDKTLNLLGVARVIGHGRWLGGVHLPASVVSPGHRKQVNTSVYQSFFLNVEHFEQKMYIVIVPAARVVVGIVGDCPHCSNAPQCLNLSERWDAKERRRQQFSCVPFQRETWQCWHASAQGQVAGLWTQMRIVFTFSKTESSHLSKASPGACQSLLRGFNLAFLKLYGWFEASCGPQAVGIWERGEHLYSGLS